MWPWRERRTADVKTRPVRVVAGGYLASPSLADGRVMPVLILDVSERPDVIHLIEAHKHLSPGDVDSDWILIAGRSESVGLWLRFRRPVECEVVIAFDTGSQCTLIEIIQISHACFLQPGQLGDRLSSTPNAPKIFVEVPVEVFRKRWDKLYHKSLTDRLHAEGLTRREAKLAARTAILENRKLLTMRASRGYSPFHREDSDRPQP
jgi:hypothetical protein